MRFKKAGRASVKPKSVRLRKPTAENGRGPTAKPYRRLAITTPFQFEETSVPIKRAAYSPAEFAAACGRHPSWAYRLLYGGKVGALTDLGRILIPASELGRVLSNAAPYNPKPRKPKTDAPELGATIGGDT